MPLKRLILVLSLLVVVTFVAGAVIYHATVYFNRLHAASGEADRELELTSQRLTNEMLDWQRFARAVAISARLNEALADKAHQGDPLQQRLEQLMKHTSGLKGISLVDEAGQNRWSVGSMPAAAGQACEGADKGRSIVQTPVEGGESSLLHCLPLSAQGKLAGDLLVNTELDALSYALPSGSLRALLLVDDNGRVLAAGKDQDIGRYPVNREGMPLSGTVHLSGHDFEARTVPVAALGGAHLVSLTSHRALFYRAIEPLIAPVGLVYLFMAGVLAFIVRKLYVAAGRDVRRRELVEQKLRRSEALYRELSVSDSLTGLYNRRKFHSDLHHELIRNRRYTHPLSIAVLDVDHFKAVNDRHGHNEGDRILRLVGHVLRNARRKTDTAYRVGGEEFVVMLPETSAKEAMVVMERIQQALAETPLQTDAEEDVTVTVSVGIAEFDGEESDRSFFNRADAAMYAVKQRHRGSIMVADAEGGERLAQP